MKWETEEIREPDPRVEITCGDIRLSVRQSGDRQWQGLVMSVGAFSNESRDSCCVTWPDEAIAMARAELDKLEAELGEPDFSVPQKPTGTAEALATSIDAMRNIQGEETE